VLSEYGCISSIELYFSNSIYIALSPNISVVQGGSEIYILYGLELPLSDVIQSVVSYVNPYENDAKSVYNMGVYTFFWYPK